MSRRPRSRSARPRLVQRVDELVALSRERTVLHLGCTNWPYTAESDQKGTLLHRTLDASARELWGLDADPAGLARLRDLGFDRLLIGDLQHLGDARRFPDASSDLHHDTDGGTANGIGAADHAGATADLARFDLVIAGEVLEHLPNPAAMLDGIRPLLAPDAEVVITVPNAYCAFRFASYALSGWRGNPEPVHPDHVAYYSITTLTHLLDVEGYDVLDHCFYDLGHEHRTSAPRSWRVINDAAMRVAPQLADGVVVRCRPRRA